VRLEGSGELKNLTTSSGIEPERRENNTSTEKISTDHHRLLKTGGTSRIIREMRNA
jgi:hypothetical protein